MAQELPVKEEEIEPISTDRPDQTEASNTIPKHTIQLETGMVYQVENRTDETEKVLMYPTSLLRIGVARGFELRVIHQYISSRTEAGDMVQKKKGFDAMAIGTKIYLCPQKGIRPEISFMGHLTLPTGSKLYRPSVIAPDFKFSLSNQLSERVKIGYNLGWYWADGLKNGAAFYTCALGYTIRRKWGFYIEAFGDKGRTGFANHLFDGGFTFLPLPNLQLDVSAGHKITAETPDYYLSCGFSVRLPK
ncbi:MAG: transporter [Cytophagaceae bacterium]